MVNSCVKLRRLSQGGRWPRWFLCQPGRAGDLHRRDRGTYCWNVTTRSFAFPPAFLFVLFFLDLAALNYPQQEIMWTLRLRVCLQNWTDGSALHSPGCLPPELIQNPVDLAQRKTSTISGVQSLLLRRPLHCSHDCPPTTPYSVCRSQSALCCSVLFTLFVVLNLIVINIFDLLCI